LATAVALGRAAGVVVIVDAAAQDLRMRELARCGADLVVVSAQKYLAAPTAGLVLGHAAWVRAVAAQQRGIGRAMKPTKEALAGTIVALRERVALDLDGWRTRQHHKAQRLVASLPSWPGVTVTAAPDPTGLPFERVRLQLGHEAPLGARALAERLRAGTPPVWVIDQHADRGELLLELVPLRDPEIDTLARALRAALGG
jgi:seryl-tRNA(Sec) selenium transferase